MDTARIQLAGHEFSLEGRKGDCLLAVKTKAAAEQRTSKIPLEIKAPCWFSENEASSKGAESRSEGWRVESKPGQPKAYALFEKASPGAQPRYVLSVAGSPASIAAGMVNPTLQRRAKGRCGSEMRAIILNQGRVSLSAKLPRALYCTMPGPDLALLWILAFPKPASGKP